MFASATGISSMDQGTKASPPKSATGAVIIVLEASSYKGLLELSTSLQYGGGKAEPWKQAELWVEIRSRTSVRNVMGTLSPLTEHS